MNSNTSQYTPVGEINFDEFNPPIGGKSRGRGRGRDRNNNPNNNPNINRGKKPNLLAEYHRLKKRVAHLERVLKIDPNNPPVPEVNPNNGIANAKPAPTRFGHDFRNYAKNKNRKPHRPEDKKDEVFTDIPDQPIAPVDFLG